MQVALKLFAEAVERVSS